MPAAHVGAHGTVSELPNAALAPYSTNTLVACSPERGDSCTGMVRATLAAAAAVEICAVAVSAPQFAETQ